MNNFTKILDKFPEGKISFHELSGLLKETEDMSEEQKKLFDFEKIAIAFSANNHSVNGYYHPLIAFDNEDGTRFEFPNKSLITKDALDYWKARAYKTSNPLLKLRYLGLQIEFRPLVGEKASGQERLDYIDAILESVEKDIFQHPFKGFEHLDRAMKIATSSKNIEYTEKVKSSYFKYDSKYSNDDSPGLYSHIVLTLSHHPGAFTTDEKDKIENGLIERYNRLYRSGDYWSLRECVELIVDYYGVKRKEETLKILRQFESKTIGMKEVIGAMRTQIFLHQINLHYFTLSSKEDYERVATEIADLGPEIVNNLTPIEIPFTEEMTQIIEEANKDLTAGTPNERLVKFIGNYWHHKDKDKHEAAQQKKNSVLGMISSIIYDQNGRPVTFSQSENDENDKDAIEHFRTFAPMMASVLHPSLLQNIRDHILGKETAIDIISHCPAFTNESIKLIDKALDAYYAGDFIQFMHIIIPQIEKACRNFVAINGESTYSNKNINSGYNHITFDGVLRKECIEDIENGDLSYHLIAVFTDNHGLNIRNDIMHGMAPLSYFTYPYADIVFHALLLIASLMKDKK